MPSFRGSKPFLWVGGGGPLYFDIKVWGGIHKPWGIVEGGSLHLVLATWYKRSTWKRFAHSVLATPRGCSSLLCTLVLWIVGYSKTHKPVRPLSALGSLLPDWLVPLVLWLQVWLTGSLVLAPPVLV